MYKGAEPEMQQALGASLEQLDMTGSEQLPPVI